jgi:hypothetical protein
MHQTFTLKKILSKSMNFQRECGQGKREEQQRIFSLLLSANRIISFT